MPNYTFIREKDGAKFTIAGDKPPSQEIVEHFSKQIPIKTEQIQEPALEESLLQKLLRLDREAVEKKEKELQERGITGIFGKPVKIQTVPKIAEQALSLGSFGKIIKGAEKLPKIARIAAETVPQAALGAGATYLGEREKGALEEEAVSTAGKGFGIETAVGAGIGLTSEAGKRFTKFLTRNIPDDLYEKAKKFSDKTAVSVENRIKQITDLGKKALKDNKKIATNANKTALKSSTTNKNSAKEIANNMTKLSKDFFKKQRLDSRTKMISKIPDSKLQNAINQEHERLIRNAQTITEDGRVLPRKDEKAVLKVFEDLFITKPKPTSILDQFGRPITAQKGKAPLQNKKIFLDNLDKLQDKTAYGAGENELKQQFSSIYSNLNNFLKQNSKEYNDLKELGQSIVKFSKRQTKFDPQLYDSNKISDDLTKSIETFKKVPDKDSLKIINNVVDQANKTLGKKYKLKDIISKFELNEQTKLLKNKGDLSDDQLNILGKSVKNTYEKNRDLGKVTEKGLFKSTDKIKQFLDDPGNTRIAEILPKEIVEQIEIEQAGRFFQQPIALNVPIGTIATPTVRALQAAKGIISSPRGIKELKRFLEGDLPITPERLGVGAKTVGRLGSRELVSSDQQKQDIVIDEFNQPKFIPRQPFPTKKTTKENIRKTRNQDGSFTTESKEELRRTR